MVYKKIGPLQDAQRAIKVVRENAKKREINKNTIGIMGFSAGGHLASTAGTHFQQTYITNYCCPTNVQKKRVYSCIAYWYYISNLI